MDLKVVYSPILHRGRGLYRGDNFALCALKGSLIERLGVIELLHDFLVFFKFCSSHEVQFIHFALMGKLSRDLKL